MPTLDAEYEVGRDSGRPFTPISKDGKLLPEVLEMLDLIAKHKLVLSTGHSSPKEVLLLTREGKKRGIDKILATNPMPDGMSVEQMKEAGELGAMIEFIYYSASPSRRGGPHCTMKQYADAIKVIGPEHCILSSCGGQEWLPIHTFAWKELFRGMRENRLTVKEIELMAKTNPVRLLGLEP